MEVGAQAVSYHLKKALENGDWDQIEAICTENEEILTDAEKTYWIRSKYMLGAFEECYYLCSIITEKKEIKPSPFLIPTLGIVSHNFLSFYIVKSCSNFALAFVIV